MIHFLLRLLVVIFRQKTKNKNNKILSTLFSFLSAEVLIQGSCILKSQSVQVFFFFFYKSELSPFPRPY